MKNKLKIYTDGACSTELRLGGWAVVYKFENEDVFCETGHATNTTNNQMELYAFYKALKFIYNSVSDCEIEIYSDSAYVVNAVKLGWLKKWSKNGWMLSSGDGKIKNVKLWKVILNILSYRIQNVQYKIFQLFHQKQNILHHIYNKLLNIY